jgi:hypothetical protein
MTMTGGPPVGAPMPDVGRRDLDGWVRRLADCRGRPLLILMRAWW